jgi:group II intron reverse transcriptase/maturase
VKVVEIPKKQGGVRRLGVPTVADRIAQAVVKAVLEPSLEPIFHRDSYGYRPGKSATEAVRVTRERCWRYDWVVEFDIQGAYDNIDHALLLRALRKHTSCQWVLLYIGRWLTVPFAFADGRQEARTKGIVQGAVISPLLMNLFLHYVCDRWMAQHYPRQPFARYADDGVLHCRTEAEAEQLKEALRQRFADCQLALHPATTRIVYCKDSNRRQDYVEIHFTFLGFTFRPRRAKNRDGRVFTSFLPAVSQPALSRRKQEIRRWRIPVQTPGTLEEFARIYNPILQGWWNYFGSFYHTEVWNVFRHFDGMLARWARRKYKRLQGHKTRSHQWVRKMSRKTPTLFVHWRHLGANTAG